MVKINISKSQWKVNKIKLKNLIGELNVDRGLAVYNNKGRIDKYKLYQHLLKKFGRGHEHTIVLFIEDYLDTYAFEQRYTEFGISLTIEDEKENLKQIEKEFSMVIRHLTGPGFHTPLDKSKYKWLK